MKFGEQLKKEQIELYADFYIDYDFLKEIIEHSSVPYEIFLEAITIEFKKINSFVNNTRINKMIPKDQLMKYLLVNYIGFYKIFKKYDKKHCKNKKFEFYKLIQKQDFFIYYKIRTPCNNIKLVIFDKDGTLIDNTLMFGKWTISLLNKLNKRFPKLLDTTDKTINIWKHLGYDPILNKFDASSVIAKGTNDDIRNSICDYIVNIKKIVKCKTIEERIQIVDTLRENWFDIEVTKQHIKQCGDIINVFNILKMNGIKIAICTNDDRKPTEKTLDILNIDVKSKLKAKKQTKFTIDYLVCGNDMLANKPSPEPLLTICKKLNVEPKNTMMVGDTMADVHAGINAKCGRIVAVLSGGYDNTKLNEADTIIPDINCLAKILLNFRCNQQKVCH